MIYPGSMLTKRLKHILFLSSITLTVWMNDMQDVLLQKALVLMEETVKFLPSQSQIKKIETVMPILKKLEDTRFGYLIEGAGLPTTVEIKRNCDAVRMVGEVIPDIVPTLKLTGKILKYTSILLALQIAFSLYWLGMDLKKGNQKLMTLSMILLALLINYKIHDILQGVIFFT